MTAGGPIRVVEAGAGIAVAYAGWLLARMGAQVVRLADDTVRDPPFDPPGLALAALALGKARETPPPGRAALQARLARADVLICDAAFAREADGADTLARRLPQLVVGVASVFGLDGPDAVQPAEAIDAQAVSGAAWATGEPGRPPLALPPGIVEHQAGAMLAAGVLLALRVAADRGTGRVVDIALADVLASHVAGGCRYLIHHGLHWRRSGRRASDSGGAYPFAILPCRDGEVCITGRTREEWQRLVAAMGTPEWTRQPRYQSLRRMGRDYPDEVDALMRPWLESHTMDELERIALAHHLIVAPVRPLHTVLATPHFVHDGFLRRDTVAGRPLRVPDLPFRARERRDPQAPDLAPALLAGRGSVEPRHAATDAPLAGLRVLDLGWVWSGPWVGTMLGELGAEVIKVETGARPDHLRLSGEVVRDGTVVPGPSTEQSPMYHQVNHGKLGITLNTRDPRAVALAVRLAGLSDLVIENQSPGAVDRQGLGWSVLSAANPRLVMLSMSGAGQFGELAAMRVYAPTMSSFGGLEALVGYPGEAPIGALNVALADPNGALHGLVAVLAALNRVRATGRGCHLDLSQIEALVGTLRGHLLDAQVHGRQPPPVGNAHPWMSPHGIYPAAGDDQWLTVAVADDTGWRALCGLASGQSWATDARFASLPGRLAGRDALDAALAAWTASQPRDRLVASLRAAGIAASPVLPVEEAWRRPGFVARGLVQRVALPFLGEETLLRAPWRFSDFEPVIRRCGPTPGEHNHAVLGGLLGLSADEIAALQAEGVVA